MTRSSRLLVALVAFALLAACGTRVDEAATQQTILVQAGTGRTVTDGATNGDETATDDTTATGETIDDGSTGTTTATGGTQPATGGTTARATGQATGTPIQLGAVGTKSGLVGAALENAFRGLIVWQEWVNSHGGIQGRPVKITVADDAADPGKHATAIRRQVLETRVVSFIGNIAPFTFSAGLPLLEQYGVSAIGGDGGEAGWFRSPVAFPINGQTASRSAPAAKWAIENLTQRKAGVFYVNEADAPKQLAANFIGPWKARGGQVVYEAGVSLAAPDFTSEIIQARDRGADILFIVLEKAACNRFFDAMRRQGYTPIVLAAACTIDNYRDHRDILTNKAYGLHAARPVLGNSPAEQEIRAAVARTDPSLPPDGAFMFAWLAGKLLEAALAQPGAVISPKGIIEALNRLPATSLNGLTPKQAWPAGPHPEGRCGMVSRFDGEKLVLQTPDFLCN